MSMPPRAAARVRMFVRPLPGGATFAGQLIAGRSLGEAAAAVLDEISDFDIATNIAGLIEAGAFTSAIPGDAA